MAALQQLGYTVKRVGGRAPLRRKIVEALELMFAPLIILVAVYWNNVDFRNGNSFRKIFQASARGGI